MCSIFGYCGEEYDRSALMPGFSQTKSRGPDDSRITETGRGLLGFHRLAIMGLTPDGMQPFELEAEGLLARAVCHECDHLEGKMYVSLVEGEIRDAVYEEEENEEETEE